MDALPLSISSKYSKPKHEYLGSKLIDSQIPDHVRSLAVELPNPSKLDNSTREALQLFQRAANYVTAGEF